MLQLHMTERFKTDKDVAYNMQWNSQLNTLAILATIHIYSYL